MAMATPSGVDPAAWAALLRWSMTQNSTGTEGPENPNPPKPMSKEDRDWLEAVMKDGVVDLVKRAGEIIDKLKTECLEPARQKTSLDDGKLDEMLQVLDELQDICEQIDFAMSLCQIGGVPPLLEMCHPATGLPDELRSAALGVIATVTQNNPYTQNALYNLNSLPLMIALATDSSIGVELRLKAIHSISCMIRNFAPLENLFFSGSYPSVTNFTEEGVFVEGSTSTYTLPTNTAGPYILASFLADDDIRVQRKGAFLVGALITQDDLSAEKLDGYCEHCIKGLVSLVGPLKEPIPEGEPGHGLDVDLREIALRTLTSFAEAGKRNIMVQEHGEVLLASKQSAIQRVQSGKDAENAQAEVDLWNLLLTSS